MLNKACPCPLTVHKDFEAESPSSSKKPSPFPATPLAPLTLPLVLVYYFCICSGERVFQSMQFTYGLCGPLALVPADAVVTDKMYNGGFFLGRLLSVPAAYLLPARLMVKVATVSCLAASAAVAAVAARSAEALWAAAFCYGLSISWQFGSMYSWLAKFMDLVVMTKPAIL